MSVKGADDSRLLSTADVIYKSFKKKNMDGSIDLDTDPIKVALVNAVYTPDQDATDEVSGSS